MGKDNILKALRTKAEGFEKREEVSEYGISEGEEILLRRKVKVTNIPCDVAAAKYLGELAADDLEGLTERQLKEEKKRLLLQLKDL